MPDQTQARPRPRWMRILLWTLALLVGLPVGLVLLVLAVVLVGANTGPGRRLIQTETATLTGGLVRIDGLSGRFPDALAVRRIEIHDVRGTWLAIDGLVLHWSPLALLGRRAHVELASAEHVAIDRLPVADPNAKPKPPPKPGQKSGLHLGIALDRLHVGRLDVAAGVSGTAAGAVAAAIDGHVRLADLAPLLDGASVATLPDTDLALGLDRLDHPGSVTLGARVTPGRLGLHLRADDPDGGFATALAHLPALDPLHLSLDLDGPRTAAALALNATAGAAPATAAASTAQGVITLAAHGTLDLVQPRFDLVLAAHAPAMQPLPGVAWNRIALDAHLTGTPTDPGGEGTLLLDQLAAAGAGIGHLAARFDGREASGPAHLHAVADAVRIPGPKPDLLAAAPLTLDATLDPHRPGDPLDLVLSHPLASVTGHVLVTAAPRRGTLDIALPDLAPLAAAGGTALEGHARLAAAFSQSGQKADVTLDGPVAITGGQPQAAGLVGPTGRLGLTVSKDGADLAVTRLALDGQAIHLSATGTDRQDVLDAHYALALPDLARALPSLRGGLSLAGTATGRSTDLAAHVEASGDPGTATMPRGPIRLLLDAQHLPNAPAGTVSLAGTLDRAPLTLKAEAARLADGALHLTVDALDWKSATGRADMTLPKGGRLPLGTLSVRMARLADLRPVLGQPVDGSVSAEIRTTQAGSAPRVTLDVRGAGGLRTDHVGRLLLAGTVDDPLAAPSVNLRLDLAGLQAGTISGSATATARGPQTALDVAARASLVVAGGPAALDTALRLDLPHKQVALSSLTATAKGETVRLLSPARIAFGPRTAVDRLRLSVASPGAAPASIDLAGEIMPRLDLTASLANITPALAKPFAPTLDAVGVLAAQAHLTGTTAAPSGTVRLTGDGLRLRTGPAASLPPATLRATASLAGGSARIDTRLDAGPNVALAAAGTVPLSATGPLSLRSTGRLDLSLANAILGAQGRQVTGVVSLDLSAGGSASSPSLGGSIRLADGSVQDFAQGVRLTGIDALIEAQGRSLSLSSLTAHAGPGTIQASGTVGALVPGLPVDLHVTASRARPLSSDLLTATLDADMRLHGQASTRLDVGGTITIDGADINVPNGLPPSVARLNVVRPGQKPAAAAASSGLLIGLDLAVAAPGQIFVRGHGLDAELGGQLHVGGTSTAPVISGSFDMRRGTFALAGVSLTFTKGRVGFDGTGLAHRIDPTLDFTAESVVSSTVADLNVGGYASAPKITLSSSPPLPQDQVLALILFGEDTKSLSALQIAEVAAALASLTGSGNGFDPLGTVRKSLGLDRLSVGSGTGTNTSGASVQAGKYVARGVYVGASQQTSGGGTQAQVQIDLTKRLKLLTTVGTGGATTGVITPQNDPGSSVALKYQFQY